MTHRKLIIDSHAHAVPDTLAKWAPWLSAGRLANWRRHARTLLKPVTGSMHHAQTFLRHLPEPARWPIDEVAGLFPIPTMLVESTPADLAEAMRESRVDYAAVIAHPPLISNEFVMELAAENPKIIPVVNIPSGTHRPGAALKKFVEQGARALKIHPAADGEGHDSSRYRTLLKSAADCDVPVIIHTGSVNTHILYKVPSMGQAQRFAPWFETYPSLRFVLAHMNFHEPQIALDLAEEYANLLVDTSWQPAEMIGEAVRRIGAEKVLFGTDWPFVGNNIAVGLRRIEDCVESGLISRAQSNLILGINAASLFGLKVSSDAA